MFVLLVSSRNGYRALAPKQCRDSLSTLVRSQGRALLVHARLLVPKPLLAKCSVHRHRFLCESVGNPSSDTSHSSSSKLFLHWHLCVCVFFVGTGNPSSETGRTQGGSRPAGGGGGEGVWFAQATCQVCQVLPLLRFFPSHNMQHGYTHYSRYEHISPSSCFPLRSVCVYSEVADAYQV